VTWTNETALILTNHRGYRPERPRLTQLEMIGSDVLRCLMPVIIVSPTTLLPQTSSSDFFFPVNQSIVTWTNATALILTNHRGYRPERPRLTQLEMTGSDVLRSLMPSIIVSPSTLLPQTSSSDFFFAANQSIVTWTNETALILTNHRGYRPERPRLTQLEMTGLDVLRCRMPIIIVS
jgi:hypothetical protein